VIVFTLLMTQSYAGDFPGTLNKVIKWKEND